MFRVFFIFPACSFRSSDGSSLDLKLFRHDRSRPADLRFPKKTPPSLRRAALERSGSFGSPRLSTNSSRTDFRGLNTEVSTPGDRIMLRAESALEVLKPKLESVDETAPIVPADPRLRISTSSPVSSALTQIVLQPELESPPELVESKPPLSSSPPRSPPHDIPKSPSLALPSPTVGTSQPSSLPPALESDDDDIFDVLFMEEDDPEQLDDDSDSEIPILLLNSSDFSDLCRIPQITQVCAQSIETYRKTHGNFTEWSDLKYVFVDGKPFSDSQIDCIRSSLHIIHS